MRLRGQLPIWGCTSGQLQLRHAHLNGSALFWYGILLGYSRLGALLAAFFLGLGMHFSSGPRLSLLYLDPTRVGDPRTEGGRVGSPFCGNTSRLGSSFAARSAGKESSYLIIFNCAMDVRRRRRRRSSYPKNPPNCARCCWRARVPVKWHLPDLRFRFLARQIDLKSWIHVIWMYCTIDFPGICTKNPAC